MRHQSVRELPSSPQGKKKLNPVEQSAVKNFPSFDRCGKPGAHKRCAELQLTESLEVRSNNRTMIRSMTDGFEFLIHIKEGW